MINKHLNLEGHDAKVDINAIEVRLAGSCVVNLRDPANRQLN